jgi:hypothetical protein
VSAYREPGRMAESDESERESALGAWLEDFIEGLVTKPQTTTVSVRGLSTPERFETVLRVFAQHVLPLGQRLLPRASGSVASLSAESDTYTFVVQRDDDHSRKVCSVDGRVAYLRPSDIWDVIRRVLDESEWQEGVAW